jgi:hypothetical protein
MKRQLLKYKKFELLQILQHFKIIEFHSVVAKNATTENKTIPKEGDKLYPPFEILSVRFIRTGKKPSGYKLYPLDSKFLKSKQQQHFKNTEGVLTQLKF